MGLASVQQVIMNLMVNALLILTAQTESTSSVQSATLADRIVINVKMIPHYVGNAKVPTK